MRKKKESPRASEAAAHWVIGDVHGCFATLCALLEDLEIDAARDRLWVVGDLVNRGPRSLEALRWAKETSEAFGERFAVVLGNHDLHLLRAYEDVVPPRAKDDFEEVLEAPDAAELIAWLRALPLTVRLGDVLMVHAGLHPDWTVEEAEQRARRLEAALRAPDGVRRLLGEGEPGSNEDRELRRDLAVLTRVRTCRESGEPYEKFSGPPDEAPAGCVPWFRIPGRRAAGTPIYFGHWAALGLHRGDDVFGLDSGCAWGGSLTAALVGPDGRCARVVQRPVIDPLKERF